MKIAEEFNKIAKDYEKKRRDFIPCFDDFYESTTNFIVTKIKSVKYILDLGAGTGLLTSFWLKHFPRAKYYLVDVADNMLSISKNRFSGLKNIEYLVANYLKEFPNIKVDCVISALSIHHLQNENKQILFNKIYEKLKKGNIFVNYDQFCAGSKTLNKWYDSYWINQIENSNLTNEDIKKWKIRKKFDCECTVEQEIQMLKKSGFKQVVNVYTNQKFSVIVAIK